MGNRQLSVISISRNSGLHWVSANTDSTCLTRSLLLNCAAETLTANRLIGNDASFCQCAMVAQASRNTHSPIGIIKPVCSAIGMNWSGTSSQCVGCCQRNRTSALTNSPLLISSCGWKYSTNWFLFIADLKSVSSSNCLVK